MIQEQIHNKIVGKCTEVSNWYAEKSRGLAFPVYSSFDVRDSGFKIAPVDANIFPAGFNNICPVDKEAAPALMRAYLDAHYPNLGRKVALLTEEHTGNAYYWENVYTIREILLGAQCEVFVCIPRELTSPIQVQSAAGREITVHGTNRDGGKLFIQGTPIDLIICNNDFSNSYESWSVGLETPMNPPRELGWYRRKKHNFFVQYNSLVTEFSQLVGINENYLKVETQSFLQFDADDPDSLELLAKQVDVFLQGLREKYKELQIPTEPFCFIKNDTGTYGLAVMQVSSGDEIRTWNSKTRKKMKAAKGGREVTEIIIQEGIPTQLKETDGGAAEPCVYLVGGELAGGFLRTHTQKGPNESLNSPGAVFKKMCMADLLLDRPGCPMENVYGWVSRLGGLAIALEAKVGEVEFKKYVL